MKQKVLVLIKNLCNFLFIQLKEQADREVREIRNDLAHKKVVMSLARSQVSTLPAVHPRVYDPLIY